MHFKYRAVSRAPWESSPVGSILAVLSTEVQNEICKAGLPGEGALYLELVSPAEIADENTGSLVALSLDSVPICPRLSINKSPQCFSDR